VYCKGSLKSGAHLAADEIDRGPGAVQLTVTDKEMLKEAETRDMTVVSDPHVVMIRPVVPQTPEGCAECLRLGSPWVHLRLCLTCGHVGCCDSSPMRHARAHAHTVGHPIVQSFEPGENWRWCYVDETMV
jgi:uncharacterized UBP type Zn finger protein